MPKKKVYLITIFILILAFFLANLTYPKYWNQSADWVGASFLRLPEKPFKLGLDLQGGTHLIYEADLSNIAKEDYSSSMEGLRDVIERRVNLFGVREPMVQVQGERLVVELAGIKDPGEAIKMIGQTPYLEFREQKENYNEILEKNREVIETQEGQIEDPFKATILTGKYLKHSELGFDQTTNRPLVHLEFNDEGAKIFEELTGKNVRKILAIYIDGIPISTPVVQEKISGGKAQITGQFTVEEARTLSRNLNAGALPVPIKLISQQSVGPILGKISLEKSLKAGMLGFLAVIIFIILFYRLPGILASLALGIYAVLVLTIFKLIPVTLTLAGIGGFILSIGMAVDANVLIFSRMREELREGKSFSQSLEEGFNRAWPAIRDGNFTTLLVAAILFGFGSSFIKGFATTLSIGILISMFSALIITKNFLKCFLGTRLERVKWLWR
ncbi:MAG: protein-export membrane protein SecD [Parcubacteria group bacterium CG2_30_36_18]|nr:MAG: protein-export membrane protein SecD [Parcubacteria group bacterium CG2_30_36_18]